MRTDMPNGAYPAFQGQKKPGRVMRPGPENRLGCYVQKVNITRPWRAWKSRS